ncbi:MAG TPA: FAD-dependent monooxygenase [Acidimicrobiia bacterium]
MTPISSPFRRRYDVVVVGARVAGASTAMLLARHGLRVLTVDRAEPGADTLSTHALMRAGVVQLARWGVLPAVREAPTPLVDRTTFHYGDDGATIAIRADEHADGLYAPRRRVLDPLLVAAARAAGVDVRHGVELLDLRRDRRGRVDGVAVRAGDTTVEVAADLVIGADGARSRTARLVGADSYRTGSHASSSVFAYLQGIPHDGYHWHFAPGVASGAIPTNDELTCVFASVPAHRFGREIRPDVRGGFWRVLRAASPELADAAARARVDGRFRTFPGQHGFFRQSWGAGWALVGDAGHFDDPSTAHGISGALRDAELLATAVLDGNLAAYQDARDDLALDIFTATDHISSFPADLDVLRGHHLALSRAMQREAAVVAGWSRADSDAA